MCLQQNHLAVLVHDRLQQAQSLQEQRQEALASLRASTSGKEEELASAQKTIEGLWDATMKITAEKVHPFIDVFLCKSMKASAQSQ